MTISRNFSVIAKNVTTGGVLQPEGGGTGLVTPGTAGNVLTSTGAGWTSAPSTGGITAINVTAPVASTGGSAPTISMAAATSLANGYLTSTDWTTFNTKQELLVSGTNVKTVGGFSVLGTGDVGTIGAAYGGTGLTAPGASGNVLTSNGTAWVSSAPAAGGPSNYTRTNYTATAGQTTFAFTYTAPYVLVYLNGVLQPAEDYTAADGLNVVFSAACVAGDIIEIVGFVATTVANTMRPDFSNASVANPVATGGTGQTTLAAARASIGLGAASRKTVAYTAVAGDVLACDTIATGAFTITLPATPVAGDKPIVIFDAGTTNTVNGFATNNLTVARNGSTIHTLAEDAIISTKGVCVTFEYINGTWRARLG